MSIHTAEAYWEGGLQDGSGSIKLPKSNFECDYSFSSRFENERGCSPEELIAGAHSACYSMALAHALQEAGYEPEQIRTIAKVALDKEGDGFAITKINLATKVFVKDIELNEFDQIAETVRTQCPVSKALKSIDIQLDAELVKDND